MVTENTLIKFGLTKDNNNLKLREVFKDKGVLKEVHVDLYSDNPLITSFEPFMLLSRIIEKNIMVENDEGRFILKKKIDKFETHFMSVLFSRITECYYKCLDNYSEFILKIQNIYYKITVFN